MDFAEAVGARWLYNWNIEPPEKLPDWEAESPDANRHKPGKIAEFVVELLPQLEAMDIVERYAWFHGGVSGAALATSKLFNPDGSLTPVGEAYRGWGVERVFRRNGDKKLLELCLGRIERFHDWYWRERDLHDNGLINLGAYSGVVQHAKWENFDYECNMDGMKMTASPAWQTPLPLPTVDRTDRRWQSGGFWRGDVWPPTNYQISSGLAAYGHHELAADIADKTIANAIKNAISENHNSVTGKALGVPDYSMSSTLVAMMCDGLSRKHRLKLRDKS